MKVILREYTEKGEYKDETSLSSIFEKEVTSDENPPEKAAELLANLTSLLVKKGLISLTDVSDEILHLDNYNPDLPVLSLPKN
jgi:hypothetical protein